MKFSHVCMSGMLALLLLTVLMESCVKSGRKRAKPECLHGEDAEGKCKPSPEKLTDVCQGDYGIKDGGVSCVFYTATQPNGCLVNGLSPIKSSNMGCVVRDSFDKYCAFEGLDRVNLLCQDGATVARTPAPVRVYLEVKESGFKPYIVFEPGEKVKEIEEFEIKESSYSGLTEVRKSESDSGGKSTITLAIKIPWVLTYTKEDGTQVCADGVLNGSNTTKDTAAQGNVCIGM